MDWRGDPPLKLCFRVISDSPLLACICNQVVTYGFRDLRSFLFSSTVSTNPPPEMGDADDDTDVPAPRKGPTTEVGQSPRMNMSKAAGQQAAGHWPEDPSRGMQHPTHENFPAAENLQDEHEEAEEEPEEAEEDAEAFQPNERAYAALGIPATVSLNEGLRRAIKRAGGEPTMFEAAVASHLQLAENEMRHRGDVKAFKIWTSNWVDDINERVRKVQDDQAEMILQQRNLQANRHGFGPGATMLSKPDTISGTGEEDFSQWVVDFENLAALHHVPAHEMLKHAISHFKGPARERWDAFNRAAAEKGQAVSWTDLKQHMQPLFQKISVEAAAAQEYSNLRCGPGVENLLSYGRQLLDLFFKMGSASEVTEKGAFRDFVQGLPRELRDHVTVAKESQGDSFGTDLTSWITSATKLCCSLIQARQAACAPHDTGQRGGEGGGRSQGGQQQGRPQGGHPDLRMRDDRRFNPTKSKPAPLAGRKRPYETGYQQQSAGYDASHAKYKRALAQDTKTATASIPLRTTTWKTPGLTTQAWRPLFSQPAAAYIATVLTTG